MLEFWEICGIPAGGMDTHQKPAGMTIRKIRIAHCVVNPFNYPRNCGVQIHKYKDKITVSSTDRLLGQGKILGREQEGDSALMEEDCKTS